MATIKELKELATRKGWDLGDAKTKPDILKKVKEYQQNEDLENAKNPKEEVKTDEGEIVKVQYKIPLKNRTFIDPDKKERARTIAIIERDTVLRTGRIVKFTDPFTLEIVQFANFDDYSANDKKELPKGMEVIVLRCDLNSDWIPVALSYQGFPIYDAHNPAYIKREDITLI